MTEEKYRQMLLHMASLLSYIDAMFPNWSGRYVGEVAELRQWLAEEKAS